VTDDMQQVTFDKHEGYFAYLEKIYFKYVCIRFMFFNTYIYLYIYNTKKKKKQQQQRI